VHNWSGTSESGTYYDADFESVETGLRPVVNSLRLRYWFGTSDRSCTYHDADFGSVETGLGPVLHTLRLTSGQCSTGFGPVRVVHTMTLTSG